MRREAVNIDHTMVSVAILSARTNTKVQYRARSTRSIRSSVYGYTAGALLAINQGRDSP